MAFARHLGTAISLGVLSRGRGSYIFDVELFIEMSENTGSRDTEDVHTSARVTGVWSISLTRRHSFSLDWREGRNEDGFVDTSV